MFQDGPQLFQYVRIRHGQSFLVGLEDRLRLEKPVAGHDGGEGILLTHPLVGRIVHAGSEQFEGTAGIDQVAEVIFVFQHPDRRRTGHGQQGGIAQLRRIRC